MRSYGTFREVERKMVRMTLEGLAMIGIVVLAMLLITLMGSKAGADQVSISDGESGSSVRSKLNDLFPFTGDFTSSNSTGFAWSGETLTVTHSKGISRSPIITVVNNNSEEVEITCSEVDTNTITLDFTGFTPISGTWSIAIF